MALLFTLPRSSQFDAVGQLMSGWTVEFYDSGTSNEREVYADQALTIPLGTSVAAGDDGSLRPIYLDDLGAAYKVLVKDADGVIVPNGTIDPYLLGPTQAQIGNTLYPRTESERANSVTPAFTIYAPSPKIDVRRHLTAWDDSSVQTTGLQTAINLAYAQKGRLVLPNGLDIKSGALSLTMDGNRATQGFAIEGPGWNGAKITQSGSPSALLTIKGPTPGSIPNEAPIVLEGFSLQGVGKTASGILLNGVAYWRCSNVQVRGFYAGFHLKSALLGVIDQNCMGNECAYGLLAERDGALPFPAGGSGCNRITVADSVFNHNSVFGLFIQSGVNWILRGLDLEGNGTSGNLNTGAVRLVTGLDSDIGCATVSLENCWFELNYGWSLLVDPINGLTLAIRDSLFLQGEGGREIRIDDAVTVSIEDTRAPTATGSIWDISAEAVTLKNVIVLTLTDTGVEYPNYVNVHLSDRIMRWGRAENATGTLTGVSGTATGTFVCVQQGDEIEIIIPSISGTSNATAATITGGIPARYRPSQTHYYAASVVDNGQDSIQMINIGSNGTVTLYKNGSATGFTASGTKGINRTVVRYKK